MAEQPHVPDVGDNEPVWVRRMGLIAGPGLFALVVAMPLGTLAGPAKLTAGVALWMAVWWMSEALPLAATSLLPLVLLPLSGVRPVSAVGPHYGHQLVFLFLGGFVLALVVEQAGLHRRLALRVLRAVGTSPRRLLWGFAGTTAVLSMWLSNTATTLMMLPIAAGVVGGLAATDRRVASAIFLGVAYGASIGGIGTLIGTPPNLVLSGQATQLVHGLPPLTFVGWMAFGVPVVIVLLPVACVLLSRGLPRGVGEGEQSTSTALAAQQAALGAWSSRERRAGVLFLLTALAWITRRFWAGFFPQPQAITDTVPAIAAAILATVLPAGGAERRPLVDWQEIRHGVPWGVLLLFGGGFALADAIAASGLDDWLAAQLAGLGVLPLPLVVLVIALLTTFATELTSNTATATLLMPVMASLAKVLGVAPYLLMVPATVSASCAFMLPVATPPNAIVLGSGQVNARDLLHHGSWLNLLGALVVTALTLLLGPLVLPGVR